MISSVQFKDEGTAGFCQYGVRHSGKEGDGTENCRLDNRTQRDGSVTGKSDDFCGTIGGVDAYTLWLYQSSGYGVSFAGLAVHFLSPYKVWKDGWAPSILLII